MASPAEAAGRLVGRYVLYDKIAAGGMAAIHIGRLQGPVGFSRTVAIKRMHPHYAANPEFVSMFLDEARLAARISHPNVVSTIDVIALGGELLLVMEYVQGETLSRLLRAAEATGSGRIPLRAGVTIVADVLHGLHAAHEATSENGQPLAIVHRDVSPHNIIAGKDGVARVLDFGIAKAASRVQTTQDGALKGKLRYMAPEQVRRGPLDRRTDVFATAIVLWEVLTGRHLFAADEEAGVLDAVLRGHVPAPSSIVSEVPRSLDEIVLKGLERDPADRYATAREMALELEQAMPLARPAEVGAFVEQAAGQVLARRAMRIAEIEGTPSTGVSAWLVESAGQGHAGSTASVRDLATMRLAPQEAIDIDVSSISSPTTQISSVSEKVRATRRIRARGALSVTVLCLAVVTVALWSWSSRRSRHPEPAVVATPAPPPTFSEPPPAAASTAPPTTPAAASAPPPVRTRPRGGTKPAPSSTPCDPPYYFDADGTKRFKPQCV